MPQAMVYLDVEKDRRIKEIAKKNGKSKMDMIQEILEVGLQKLEDAN